MRECLARERVQVCLEATAPRSATNAEACAACLRTNASRTSSPTSNAGCAIAGPSHASSSCGGQPSAAIVDSSTPPTRPRQPACATPTRVPARSTNTTGRQSAVITTHTRPGATATDASARGGTDAGSPACAHDVDAVHLRRARAVRPAGRPRRAGSRDSPRPPPASSPTCCARLRRRVGRRRSRRRRAQRRSARTCRRRLAPVRQHPGGVRARAVPSRGSASDRVRRERAAAARCMSAGNGEATSSGLPVTGCSSCKPRRVQRLARKLAQRLPQFLGRRLSAARADRRTPCRRPADSRRGRGARGSGACARSRVARARACARESAGSRGSGSPPRDPRRGSPCARDRSGDGRSARRPCRRRS